MNRSVAILRRRLPPTSYDIVRGGRNNRKRTYVDFDCRIGWCRELGINDLADRLLHLRRIENERAMDVQQDHISSPARDDSAAPILPRSINSDPGRTPAVFERLCSQGLSSPDGSVDAGDESPMVGLFLEEGRSRWKQMLNGLTLENPENLNDTMLLRQSNDEAEKNHPECMEGSPSRNPHHTIPIEISYLGIHRYRRSDWGCKLPRGPPRGMEVHWRGQGILS